MSNTAISLARSNSCLLLNNSLETDDKKLTNKKAWYVATELGTVATKLGSNKAVIVLLTWRLTARLNIHLAATP